MTDPIVPRRIWLKPTEGLVLINPETGVPVSPEGDLVLDTKYFRRRITDGDAIEIDAPTKSKAK